MTQFQAALLKAINDVFAQQGKKQPKAVKVAKPKASKPAKAAKLPRADYLALVKAKFAKAGIDVTFDPKTDRFVDVLPAKGWIKLGRIPAKGQHNINGLFHKSQTNALAPKGA